MSGGKEIGMWLDPSTKWKVLWTSICPDYSFLSPLPNCEKNLRGWIWHRKTASGHIWGLHLVGLHCGVTLGAATPPWTCECELLYGHLQGVRYYSLCSPFVSLLCWPEDFFGPWAPNLSWGGFASSFHFLLDCSSPPPPPPFNVVESHFDHFQRLSLY